jgi:hypothetical protein
MWLFGQLWLVMCMTYYEVMTIVVCDMQFEDTKVQQIMWTKLNDMM